MDERLEFAKSLRHRRKPAATCDAPDGASSRRFRCKVSSDLLTSGVPDEASSRRCRRGVPFDQPPSGVRDTLCEGHNGHTEYPPSPGLARRSRRFPGVWPLVGGQFRGATLRVGCQQMDARRSLHLQLKPSVLHGDVLVSHISGGDWKVGQPLSWFIAETEMLRRQRQQNNIQLTREVAYLEVSCEEEEEEEEEKEEEEEQNKKMH
nr:unnamed protein product [Spirometra erinaceieuropaei]